MSACALGIDVGSTTWKGVAVDAGGAIVAKVIEPTHPSIEKQTEACLARLRAAAAIDEQVPMVATGYGRKRVQAQRTITEITCHARGAFARVGQPGLLIDIGGQDTKVIRLGELGEVIDFAMNDKCAAGTGRFLEVILQRLSVPFDEVAERSARATSSVSISSTCTVFAESEVVSRVAQGESLDGILRGLHQSLASRVAALAGRVAQGVPIFMSGGVALNRAMISALGDALERDVSVIPEPQLVGALGAALEAKKNWSAI
jgi:predicted CoA-substrate-specific enzyme activase